MCIDFLLECFVYVAIIQSNGLTPKIPSDLYLRLSGIPADSLRSYAVAFSVYFDCATLILHLSRKSSGVLFEIRSDDMNVRGSLN